MVKNYTKQDKFKILSGYTNWYVKRYKVLQEFFSDGDIVYSCGFSTYPLSNEECLQVELLNKENESIARGWVPTRLLEIQK